MEVGLHLVLDILSSPRSLFTLCLQSVASNFDRFVFAHGASKVVRENFELLQMVCSEELIAELSQSTKNVKEEYLPLLLNRHLKELDIERMFFHICPEKILEVLKGVENKISRVWVPNHQSHQDPGGRFRIWSENNLMELAEYIPGVQELKLENTTCSDRVMEVIGRNCLLLQTLNIKGCHAVTDEGLRHLCKKNENGDYIRNFQLQELLISGNDNVTTSGVDFCLTYFPALENLVAVGVGEVMYLNHKNDISCNHVTTYSLENLFLRSCLPDKECNQDITKTCCRVCPNVTSLCIPVVISQSELNAYLAFCNINEITLRMEDRDSCSILPFLLHHGNRLQYIALLNCKLSAAWIVIHCPNVQKLELSDVEFLPAEPVTGYLLKLMKLYLEEIYVDTTTEESVYSIISASQNLCELFIKQLPGIAFREGFYDDLLENGCFQHLRKLHLSKVDIRVIEFICTLPRLETVEIDHLPFDTFFVLKQVLKEMKPLAKLSFNIIRSS